VQEVRERLGIFQLVRPDEHARLARRSVARRA
jgi:hypothetical protein